MPVYAPLVSLDMISFAPYASSGITELPRLPKNHQEIDKHTLSQASRNPRALIITLTLSSSMFSRQTRSRYRSHKFGGGVDGGDEGMSSSQMVCRHHHPTTQMHACVHHLHTRGHDDQGTSPSGRLSARKTDLSSLHIY